MIDPLTVTEIWLFPVLIVSWLAVCAGVVEKGVVADKLVNGTFYSSQLYLLHRYCC